MELFAFEALVLIEKGYKEEERRGQPALEEQVLGIRLCL
jgi:hypothetical protein